LPHRALGPQEKKTAEARKRGKNRRGYETSKQEKKTYLVKNQFGGSSVFEERKAPEELKKRDFCFGITPQSKSPLEVLIFGGRKHKEREKTIKNLDRGEGKKSLSLRKYKKGSGGGEIRRKSKSRTNIPRGGDPCREENRSRKFLHRHNKIYIEGSEPRRKNP